MMKPLMTTLYYPMTRLNTTGEELVTIEIMGCQKGSIFSLAVATSPPGHTNQKKQINSFFITF